MKKITAIAILVVILTVILVPSASLVASEIEPPDSIKPVTVASEIEPPDVIKPVVEIASEIEPPDVIILPKV